MYKGKIIINKILQISKGSIFYFEFNFALKYGQIVSVCKWIKTLQINDYFSGNINLAN